MNVELLIAGAALLAGFVFFALGASAPDYTGLNRQVWGDPVPVVGKHPGGWRWANNAFTASGILTLLGLGLLTLFLYEDGSRIFAPAGLLLFGTATVFWLAFSAFRKRVTAWAGARYLEQSSQPVTYEPLGAWGGELGKLYMLMGYLATAALGAALLQTGFLPAWIGWVSVVLGTAGAVVMLIGRPSPDWADETYAEIPFWLQIAPFLMGIALVLRAVT
jgi:hypothetical protein